MKSCLTMSFCGHYSKNHALQTSPYNLVDLFEDDENILNNVIQKQFETMLGKIANCMEIISQNGKEHLENIVVR